MEIEIIILGNLKNEKYEGLSFLIPSITGQIFLDDKSQDIITEIEKGELIINHQNGSKKIPILYQGILIHKKGNTTLLLK